MGAGRGLASIAGRTAVFGQKLALVRSHKLMVNIIRETKSVSDYECYSEDSYQSLITGIVEKNLTYFNINRWKVIAAPCNSCLVLNEGEQNLHYLLEKGLANNRVQFFNALSA